ncbi:hypothetical protein LJ739_06710 [Aestuariibacter halophilus]|uniref:Uncharacterized protein n=1 Tax=Fluctibacter halophilus TaxID=226011 RepID=A0ABS8G5R5_9ALTE|nr:hypothetical protein [Aestuariibacter halophilus]MCC2615927.1 hypothetical protein [Aestuariibacter halophilus]
MSWYPIAFTIPQYVGVSNYWLKFYVPGTTTAISMATASEGTTTIARAEINVEGFPKTSGGALFIPYIDQAYDLYAFPTSAEADANDTTNAVKLADNVNPVVKTTGGKQYLNLASAIADTSLLVDDVVETAGYNNVFDFGAAKYVVVSGSTPGTTTALDLIVLDNGLKLQFVPMGNTISPAQAGAQFLDEGISGADDAALQACIDYAIANGGILSLNRGEMHLYDSHDVGGEIMIEGCGDESILRNHTNTAVTLNFDTAYGTANGYKSTVLRDFRLQSDGTMADTAIKIRRWFESCAMYNVYAIGHRIAFDISNSYNPSFYNSYARQAANRHAPTEGNDANESYGWYVHQNDGPVNAISFFHCSAERYWHNWCFDNTADAGNFVAIQLYGGVCQTAWQSGMMCRGGGIRITIDGVYFENNYEQAQRVSDGAGVASDQGVNITFAGIVGADEITFGHKGGYMQMSQNLKNNTPANEVNAVYVDATIETFRIVVDGVPIVANDPNSYDHDYVIDGGGTTLDYNMELLRTPKDSINSIVIPNDKLKETTLWTFGPDAGNGGFLNIDRRNFTAPVGRVFIEVYGDGAYTCTTAPSYTIQDYQGNTIDTIQLPTTSGSGVVHTQRINGLTAKQIYRIAQNATIAGLQGTPDFYFRIFTKDMNPQRFITRE